MSRRTNVSKIKRASMIRRGFPIHGYVGGNGGGKSLAMVYDTLPSLAAGRPVLSTLRLIDPSTGGDHPLWVPLGLDPDVPPEDQPNPYKVMLEAESCDMLLDEITGVASSRDSMSLPSAVANMLVQLRRRDIALRWSSPSWKRADTIIRECTQGVTHCVGLVKETIPASDGSDRSWQSRKVFYWRTYDAVSFDEFSAYRKEKTRPQVRQLLRRSSTVAPLTYDTFAPVRSLAEVTDSGRCMDCGGKRTAPKCACGTTSRPRPASTPVDAPTQVIDPEEVVRQWRARHQVTIPETDDTPAVTVELPTVDPRGAVTSP